MIAILKREWKSYFQNITGWLFIAAVLALYGLYFLAYNLRAGYPYVSYTLSAISFIMLIAVPILTMRSMAEERHSRTDQLVLTAPVSLGKMISGHGGRFYRCRGGDCGNAACSGCLWHGADGRKLCGGFGLLAVRMYLHRSRYAGVGADGESGNCSGGGVCIPFSGIYDEQHHGIDRRPSDHQGTGRI